MTATTSITVKLTAKELGLLCSLASAQLFHREFIDARLPGYQCDPAELGLGKSLIERLRFMTNLAKKNPLPQRKGTAA
ncbi:MAG TPA: hypothetical protein VKR43_13065 [Bryobacteraceae bacterium]|jgi:hypothetical protein|nr:hypothetical protein [Bryobacteraceae bacterium]